MKKKLHLIILFSLFLSFSIYSQTQLIACDNNDDGIEFFDLTSASEQLLSGQNPTFFIISYHTTESNAIENVGAIVNPTSFVNTSNYQIIWARITNVQNNEFEIMPFSLSVEPTPIVTLVNTTVCSNGLKTLQANVNTPGSYDYFWIVPPGITNPGNTSTFTTNAQGNFGVFVINNVSGCQSATDFIFLSEFALNIIPGVLFWCEPEELPLYNLDDAIPQISNGGSSLFITFYTSLIDAETNSNPIPNNMGYIPTQVPVEILFARVEDFESGCVSITTLTLNTNNCDFECQTATNVTANNITDTSLSITWTNATNSSNVPAYWFIDIVPIGQPFNGFSNTITQAPTFTFTGLTQNTCYSVYISSVCFVNGMNTIVTTGPFNFCLMDCTNNGLCPEQLNLIAFFDENNNGIKEENEILFNSGSFVYEINDSGETIYGNSGSGNFTLFEPNPDNSYDFSFEVNESLSTYFSCSTTYSNITAPEGSGSSTYYFPITSIQPHADVSVTLIGNSQPRPGFTYTNTIAIKNNSYTTVPFGNISFTKDNNVTIISVSEISIVSTATGFDYSYWDLAPFETRYITVTMQVPTMPTVNLGDVLINSVSVEAIENEVNLTNNTFALSQVVVGSYDPNDKNESHGGKIVFADFTADDYLYYTIRFENTGTAAAEFIRIEDTLESRLDETTFEMLNASHQYNVRRTNNKLVWNFLDIDLPPTIENPFLSQGFVHFKIKPKPGFAIGDVIENTAEIYFDYNPPIITNTIETEFVENLSVGDFSISTVVLYPNPTKNNFQIKLSGNDLIEKVMVFDVLGKQIHVENKIERNAAFVDSSTFTNGIYLVEITTTSNQRILKKIVKQ